MRRKTKVILEAVSSLLAMALASGGYLLMSFIMGMLIVSPLWLMVAKIMLNVCFIIYNVIPFSSKVGDWISDKVTKVYRYFKFRPSETATGRVYYAEIIS
jgi:hypothetical protein